MKRQAALASLGRKALSSAPLAVVLAEAVELVAAALEVTHVAILEHSGTGDAFVVRAAVGWPAGEQVDVRGSHVAYALSVGEAVVVEDYARESRFAPAAIVASAGVRSGAVLPITCAAEPWGVLAAHSLDRAGFDDEDVTFVQLVVNVLAAAITATADAERLAFHSHLLDRVPSAVIATDVQGLITYANAAAATLYGFEQETLLGRAVLDVTVPAEQRDIASEVMEAIRVHGRWEGEFEVQRADGTTFTAYVLDALVLDAAGEPAGIVGISQDVSERHRLEAELRQVQKLEAIGRLAGGIAHDFNNLLLVINGYTDIALGRLAGDSALRRPLEEARRAGERGAELTRQLLAFSRRQRLEPELTDLGEVVDGYAGILQRLLGSDICVETSLAADLGAVRVDRSQLGQVILNLAVNARDAMPGGGVFSIAAANVCLDESAADHTGLAAGPYARLTFADTGEGMDAATAERAFDPFFTTKPADQGTGLGLSTVRGIVEQFGGTIALHTRPGEGTTFDLHLPTIDEQPLPGSATAAVPPGAGQHVLVVDDDPMMRELIEATLTDAGYRVTAAALPGDALAADGAFDLVLTDVVMPQFNGPELVERLRERHPGLPALFISGYTERMTGHSGGEALVKPFEVAELKRRVRRALDGSRALPGARRDGGSS